MDPLTLAVIIIGAILLIFLVVVTKGQILGLILEIALAILGKDGGGFGGGKFSGGGSKRSF